MLRIEFRKHFVSKTTPFGVSYRYVTAEGVESRRALEVRFGDPRLNRTPIRMNSTIIYGMLSLYPVCQRLIDHLSINDVLALAECLPGRHRGLLYDQINRKFLSITGYCPSQHTHPYQIGKLLEVLEYVYTLLIESVARQDRLFVEAQSRCRADRTALVHLACVVKMDERPINLCEYVAKPPEEYSAAFNIDNGKVKFYKHVVKQLESLIPLLNHEFGPKDVYMYILVDIMDFGDMPPKSIVFGYGDCRVFVSIVETRLKRTLMTRIDGSGNSSYHDIVLGTVLVDRKGEQRWTHVNVKKMNRGELRVLADRRIRYGPNWNQRQDYMITASDTLHRMIPYVDLIACFCPEHDKLYQ